MAVYVDDMLMQATVPNGRRSVTGKWSHLKADTEEELVEFAVEKLGMRRSWLQYPGTPKFHFDVVASVRLKAIKLGAIPVRCGSDEWMRVFSRRAR